MGQIRLQNVSKQFGGRVVLDQVSLDLASGELVGLVGPNGAGKTTLFKLITGALTPDSGTVTISRGMDVGYLAQEPVIRPDVTLHDEVAGAFAEIIDLEHRMHALGERMAHAEPGAQLDALMQEYDRLNARFVAADGYTFEHRLKEILAGLGFSQADHQLPTSALSGGQKCRAALAKLLLQDAQFFLLDEPTNHLDIDAVRWLEKFLASHRGGAVIISHDRYFLDRLTTRIVELERAKLASFPGNYSNYTKTRAVRRLTQERQYEKDREFIEKERDFIARNIAGQRSSEAKGRRTRLERRIGDGEFVLERPAERQAMKLTFAQQAGRPWEVLVADGLSKKYGEKRLFDNLGLRVVTGQRVGITGPNGTGKSTLLKILLDRLPPDAGSVRRDPKALVGYYAQDARDIDPARTILEEIRQARPDLTDERIRGILGGFLFSGDDAFKLVGALSGGEQSRVRLLKLILSAANVLVLDEPTNHLDIPSREALEEALSDFPGTLIAVSHDRYFLDRITNRLFVMRPEGVRDFNGTYSAYVEVLEAEQARREAATRATRDAQEPRGRAPVAARKPAKKKSPYAGHSVEQLEALITEREGELARLNEQFGDAEVCRDPAKLADLQGRVDALRAEVGLLEEAWGERIA